jgi:hypothetical protein
MKYLYTVNAMELEDSRNDYSAKVINFFMQQQWYKFNPVVR